MNTKFGPKTTDALQKPVTKQPTFEKKYPKINAAALVLLGAVLWGIVLWLSLETIDRYLKGVGA